MSEDFQHNEVEFDYRFLQNKPVKIIYLRFVGYLY
jgi:hypothetical protein